ncbi:MAG: APC family permease [Erysipelotrichaceae bacterium]|jgi:Ca2+/Na+ antiporter|nr:APC family permease [Erysipelotrichaceae bacterium]
MKKALSENKKVALYTVIGIVLMLISVIFTGVIGISKHVQGFKATIGDYGAIWAPVSNMGKAKFLLMGAIYLDLAILLVNVVYALLKKKPLRILPALCLALAVAFLPFLALLIRYNLSHKSADTLGLVFLAIFAVINVLAIIMFLIALYSPFAQPVAKQEVREERVPLRQVATGISEEKARRIIEEYLAAHVDEYHSEEEEKVEQAKAEEPVKEEPVKEEPVKEVAPVVEEELDDDNDDEEKEEEEIEVVDENGQIIKIKRKKRVHFETRLRNSEYDIRHKYYDLRDYLKWYGLNNRISIPGDTFSLKRKKYAFITIQGKHIKFYAAVDPSKYEDSPIPVEVATAKRFIDTPCMLRIKSDLSYRRAKLIVDEMMKEAGFEKPEGPEPKETQHPENK